MTRNIQSNSLPSAQLLVAEPFHPFLHGIDSNSTPGIESHMLVYTTFEPGDLISGEAAETVEFLNDSYDDMIHTIPPHPVIRNYPHIIAPDGRANFHLTLGSVIELPGKEQVMIDRIQGLKRFQRRIRTRYAVMSN
jgi:hypothetical protein